jgi:hypothetical protein
MRTSFIIPLLGQLGRRRFPKARFWLTSVLPTTREDRVGQRRVIAGEGVHVAGLCPRTQHSRLALRARGAKSGSRQLAEGKLFYGTQVMIEPFESLFHHR